MKILFVIEHFYPYIDASAKVLKNLLSSNEFSDHEIYVVSVGNKCFDDNGIHIHNVSINDSVFFKFKRKLFRGKFVKNKRLIRKFNTAIEAICNELEINNVIYVIGDANLLALKPNINASQNYIFYDALLDDFFFDKKSKKYIEKMQTRAFGNAKCIFMLEEYLDTYRKRYKEFSNKFYSFYITAFYNDNMPQVGNTHILLHTGAFFSGLREPNLFFDFLYYCEKANLDFKAITLGALPNAFKDITIPNNLKIESRVFGNDYDKLVASAECLVLVDNCESCIQIPSKAYEYIGYNKKILFFTRGVTNTSMLLRNNENVFKIDKEINGDVVGSFIDFLKTETTDERWKYYKNEKDYVARHLLEKLK